jgi:4-amino-4-deoxy-L-arabinose transferase-like glycosyltransferase
MLNLIERHSYRELLLPLNNLQVAPLGFLAAQFAAIRHAGTSEWALRLFPFLTGLAAVALFARLAWLALKPTGAMCAFGILAATHYVTRYSLDIKPYGTDLMAAALLLMLAVAWMRRPQRLRYLAGLAVAAPVMVFFSYPVVFVAGAVSIGLLPTLWRQPAADGRRVKAWLAFAAYNAALVAAFGLMLHLSGSAQYQATREGMLYHWEEGMPPANPLRFLVWIAEVHTAEMFAYPFGAKNGGSSATFLLCLLGVWVLWKQGQKQLLLMLGAGFVLTFAAAVMKRYPYGGSARVAQHLAPAICLLAGAAVAELIARLGEPGKTAHFAAGVLVVIALGGMTRDIVLPYQTIDDKEVQQFFQKWQGKLTAEQGVWYPGDFEQTTTPMRWYLFRALNWDTGRVATGKLAGEALEKHREWWVLWFDPDPAEQAAVAKELAGLNPPFSREETLAMKFSKRGHTIEAERWRR